MWKEELSRRRNKNRGPKVGTWKQEASWLDLRGRVVNEKSGQERSRLCEVC